MAQQVEAPEERPDHLSACTCECASELQLLHGRTKCVGPSSKSPAHRPTLLSPFGAQTTRCAGRGEEREGRSPSSSHIMIAPIFPGLSGGAAAVSTPLIELFHAASLTVGPF